MSLATLRALFASIPDEPVRIFFDALSEAGWEPEEDEADLASIGAHEGGDDGVE
jgi:hypothetical protein